jgi:hypothetical protein
VEEDESGPSSFLNAEQVQLLAELAMVALLGFLDPRQVGIQIFLAEKRGAVNALQLRIVLVALPIRARHR